ncbi:retrovirus-related pol polyprotein from transposon TNT 1-94 [Tanacetum coccineum]
MKIEESLNVTFSETPPPSKTSPLVDYDLDEEDAIKVTEKKNLKNDIEDETLEIDVVVNIKESRNHPLENVIGNLNQRTLRSQAQNQSNFFCFISNIEPKNVNEALKDEKMLKKFGLEDSKPMKTPMSSDAKLTKNKEYESLDSTKYRGIIGSFLYLTASRPDIMFSVCLCARFLEDPKTSHLEAVKSIFRYIKGTMYLGLWYLKGTDIETVVYANSNHAGDYVERKSTSCIRVVDKRFDSKGLLEKNLLEVGFQTLLHLKGNLYLKFVIEFYQTFKLTLVSDVWIILFEINGKRVGASLRDFGTLLDIPFEGHCSHNNEWSLKSINNHNATPTNEPLYTKLTHPTSIIYNITKKRLKEFKFALEDPCNLFVEEIVYTSDCVDRVSFLHVFGALCYPTNDDEDLGRLNPKADIGIFIGYSPSNKAYRIYNKRTQIIMEKIHISSGLILNSAPATSNNPPTKKDLDILFQPMFDEYFKPSPSDVSPTISAATLLQDIARRTSSTTTDQDAPSPKFDSDTFTNPFAPLVTSSAESTSRIVDT